MMAPQASLFQGQGMRVRLLALKGWLVGAWCLLLSSCMSVSVPVESNNVCEMQASMVNPENGSGLGGTGSPAALRDPGGIGGTGIVAGRPLFGEGGIGGTGIVGVITGFASICINGLEVQYDTHTPVWDNGQPSSTRQLVVGQVVSVTATGSGQNMMARSIGMVHAVVGPLTSVDAAQGTLQVLGQKVSVLESQDLANLRKDQWVRVSGLRQASGEMLASHVQALPVQAGMLAQVRGPANAIAAGTLKVGDTPVNLGSLALPAGIVPGRELWVSGVWNGSALQAQQVVVNPTREGLGRVERVVLEGFIHQLNQREMSLGFEPLQLSEKVQVVGGTQAALAVNRRVQVSGKVGVDQRITVDRVELSPYGGGDSSGKSGRGKSSNSGKGSSSGASGSSGGSGNSGSGSSGSGSSGGGSSGGGGSGSGGSGSGGSGGNGK